MKKFPFLHLFLVAVLYVSGTLCALAQDWNQILKFSGANRTTRSTGARGADNFGRAVAVDGNYAAVAAPQSNPTGAVFLYQFSAGSWSLIKKLEAPDLRPDDRFGYSVALQGGTLVVGVPNADWKRDWPDQQVEAGAAYVFEKDRGGTDNWGFAKKLLDPVPNSYDVFGNAVAINGNTIAVGSYLEDEDAGNNYWLDGSGAVYLFVRNEDGAGNWGLVKKLVPTDRSLYAGFGYAVSMGSGILAVGAYREYFDASGANILMNAGAVYIYSTDAGGVGNWGQVKKLVAPDRAFGDMFGQSVGFSNGLLAVGVPHEDEDESGANTRSNAGSVYLFQQDYGGPNTWGLVKKLVASDRDVDDNFGYAITLAGDMVAVGASAEDEDAAGLNTQTNAGSAYIFMRNTGGSNNWGQLKKLVAPDRAADDQFGISLAAGSTSIMVGADMEDDDTLGLNTVNSAGSAYFFGQDAGGAGNWGNQQKIVLTDLMHDQQFGCSVAIDGDYAVVGHRGDFVDAGSQNHLTNAGSAWVLKNTNGFWMPVKKLLPDDRGASDYFGNSVAISGTTVVVGSPNDDEDAAGMNMKSNAGSAYIFSKDKGGTDNWGQEKKLVAADRSLADQFGTSVTICGTVVAVGAYLEDEDATGTNPKNDAGSVYIFYKDQGGTNNWGQLKKVVASDRNDLDYFGYSTSLSGDILLVGAYNQDEGALNAGAAYLFAKDEGGTNTWGQVKKLYAPDRDSSDLFGTSVAISGNMAVVGAHYEDEDAAGANTKTNAGSAYLFAKDQGDTGNWGLVKKLVSTNHAAGALFGYAVAISDTIVAVGAPNDNNSYGYNNGWLVGILVPGAGSAYLFTQNQGGANNWGQVQKTFAADWASGRLGFAVAISGNTVLAGAYQDNKDVNGDNALYGAGSVYFFKGTCASYSLAAHSGMVVSKQLATTYYANGNCALIAAMKAIGDSAVYGSVTARLWIEPAQPAAYVLRHYEVTPASNQEFSTGRLTLYFTQSEFDAFNTINAAKLPTGPDDAAGKDNLLVEKRGGISRDGSGSPFTYPGKAETINPADNDIVWNAAENRWEVTFDVTGFGGFFVKTTPEILPIHWMSFTGLINKNGQAALTWMVQENAVDRYSIEKSADGQAYTEIGYYRSVGDGKNSYHFTEYAPLKGDAFYRIRETNKLNTYSYSPVIRLKPASTSLTSIFPNPVKDKLFISINSAIENTMVIITDMQGRQVRSVQMAGSTQTIDMSGWPAGIYVIRVGNGDAVKVVKE